MPVSAIATSTNGSTRRMLTVTRPPVGVNLTALASRFQNICCKRRESALTNGTSSINSTNSATLLASAVGRTLSTASARIRGSAWGPSCNLIWPVIIRETSSTSAMSCACTCAFFSTISRIRGTRCGSTCDFRSMYTHPRIAFSGVRSSCDKVARNSSFKRLARSASVRAACSATSTSRSSYCR